MHLANWPPRHRDEVLHNLSYVQWAQGNHDEAMSSISSAVVLAPLAPEHRDARARWAIELERYDVAIRDCTALLDIERARRSEAFTDAALALRAFASIQTGDLATARADLCRLTDEGPFRIARGFWSRRDLLEKIKKSE
jgi:tetratricopeptide (TPR) repeat protein